MSAVTVFAAGLVACVVGIVTPEARGAAILVGFICLLAGLRRLGD